MLEGNYLNQIILEGIIYSEVRVFKTNDSKNVEFYLLSNFSRKNLKEKIKVICWNVKEDDLNELCKDSHIIVIGKLHKDKFTNKKGDKINTFKISAKYIKKITEKDFSELPI